MGSVEIDVTPELDAPEEKSALLCQLGVRDDGAAPMDGYPKPMSDDELTEIWMRIKKFRVEMELEATNGTPTTLSFGGEVVSQSADEQDMEDHWFAGDPPIWTADIDGDQDGSPTTFTVAVRHSIVLTEILSATVTPYYYVTPSEPTPWLPNLEVVIRESFLNSASSIDALVSGGGFTAHNVTGTYRGTSFSMVILIPDGYSVSSFSLSIEPLEWLPYENDDLEPVWDTATGAELSNHSVPAY